MSNLEHTVNIPNLTVREAVTDAMYRWVAGIDDSNEKLFQSAMVQNDPDFIFECIGVTKTEGTEAFNDYMRKNILPIPTTHQITNVRVSVAEGADTASLNCHAIAYHYRQDEAFAPAVKSFVSAGLYFVDLVKGSDGLWKIKKAILKPKWTDGDFERVIFGKGD